MWSAYMSWQVQTNACKHQKQKKVRLFTHYYRGCT